MIYRKLKLCNLLFFITTLSLTLLGNDDKPEILFIGNSHTYVNDLEQIFKRISDSKGDSVYVQRVAFGGYKFSQHATNQQTLRTINERQWDYVVLQEGINSTLPPEMAREQSYAYALMLRDKVKKNCPDTEVIIYMVHTYPFGTTYRCDVDPVVCSYPGMYLRLVENNTNIGNLLNAELAPCTVVWNEIIVVDDQLPLWSNDLYHPSPMGSYISACTIYATIFDKDLEGAYVPSNISTDLASLFHEKVNEVVLNDSSGWNESISNIGNFIPYRFDESPILNKTVDEYFSYQFDPYIFIDDDTLQYSLTLLPFGNLPDNFSFDTANLELSGTPDSIGTLLFEITAYDSDSLSVSDTLQINVQPATDLDNERELSHEFALHQNYPNPFNPSTNISYSLPEPGKVELAIFNVVGQKVATLVDDYQSAGKHEVQFDAFDIPSGVYFYKLFYGNRVKTNKMMLIK
jgi:hypothetical protein